MEEIKSLEIPKQPDVVLKTKEKIEDNYKVKEELGKGKFGVVNKVEDKRNGKIYAAKWIKMSSASRDETMGEIKMMNKLHSKRLIYLHDAYETKTNLIVVLELVSGGELFEKVASEDNLTELEASRYIKQVLQAVYHMHSKKIVHLDLKPENILCVPKPGGKDDIKLIDFGMAKEVTPGLKVICGTPEFVAPEVLKCEEVTLSSDMWSIGVIAYVLLSGLSPFAGESDTETMQNVIDGDFDFEDEDGSFDAVSECGREFIEDLLFLTPF